ncbi:MAG: glycosyltransferase [Prevotella sp.]|jgi:glycosyltransferase involved in cell wall biosynthesis|nr:glycosyltransferase [Prevotella sp.]
MKIFQVITVSEYGGAQSVVANLSSNIENDNRVFILYGGEGEAWEVISRDVVKIRLSKPRKGFSAGDFFLFLRLLYYRIKYRPDIVHLHSSKMGALGRIAFNPATVVYTVHGFDSLRIAFKKWLFVEKLLKNRAACIVGVSRYDIDGLKAEGISKNVALVYNGLTDYCEQEKNMDAPLPLAGKFEELKAKYPKLILCISRISKQKKFDLFVELSRRMPSYAFVWIGNKYEMTGLPANAYCLGETESAHTYLNYADLFILPSNYEGLPMSILEALSYGVPVVASAVGGIGEILDGSNGFAVENTAEAFEEKINYCMDETVRARMSEAARNAYLQKFTIDKMVDGYKQIYERLYERQRK